MLGGLRVQISYFGVFLDLMGAVYYVERDFPEAVGSRFRHLRIGLDEPERLKRLIFELRRALTGALKSKKRHPGRLVVLFVLAGRFAERLRILRAVENVVDHLEGNAAY